MPSKKAIRSALKKTSKNSYRGFINAFSDALMPFMLFIALRLVGKHDVKSYVSVEGPSLELWIACLLSAGAMMTKAISESRHPKEDYTALDDSTARDAANKLRESKLDAATAGLLAIGCAIAAIEVYLSEKQKLEFALIFLALAFANDAIKHAINTVKTWDPDHSSKGIDNATKMLTSLLCVAGLATLPFKFHAVTLLFIGILCKFSIAMYTKGKELREAEAARSRLSVSTDNPATKTTYRHLTGIQDIFSRISPIVFLIIAVRLAGNYDDDGAIAGPYLETWLMYATCQAALFYKAATTAYDDDLIKAKSVDIKKALGTAAKFNTCATFLACLASLLAPSKLNFYGKRYPVALMILMIPFLLDTINNLILGVKMELDPKYGLKHALNYWAKGLSSTLCFTGLLMGYGLEIPGVTVLAIGAVGRFFSSMYQQGEEAKAKAKELSSASLSRHA